MAAYEEDENWPEIFVKVSHLSWVLLGVCPGAEERSATGRG
jgi:hypothetical protein